MAGAQRYLGALSLILIAASIVLIFFVVLSGVTDSTPLNKTYFLKADTSSIPGAGRDTSQWTFFYVCGAHNRNCGKPVPALPFGYAWVGGTAGAPHALVGNHAKHTTSTYYYYMWRFGWVFYLMGLVLDVIAFFTALLAPFSRLASGLSGMILASALFFFTLATSLMTAEFVKARKHFRNAGMSADLGEYAFGFTWGAWAAMFIATVMLFLGCGISSRKERAPKIRSTGRSRWFFFRRNRSRRSARGSIIDNESQRRVKEEYS